MSLGIRGQIEKIEGASALVDFQGTHRTMPMLVQDATLTGRS